MAQGSALIPGDVQDMARLVEYAEGAVVSRVIHKNAAGNVTLFAFDAGEGLSEHTAPFDALVCVFDGVGEMTIGGEPRRVATGETVLMPAGVPHSVHAPERFKMMLVMLREKK